MADFQQTLVQLTARDADGVPGAVMLALQNGKGASLLSSMLDCPLIGRYRDSSDFIWLRIVRE